MQHIPVLLNEVIKFLNPQNNGVYCDVTFGQGGMSKAILEHNPAMLYALDRDEIAMQKANEINAKNFQFCRGNFSDLMASHNLQPQSLDGLLCDCGISSPQIDSSERGFSFKYDAPLDMRMDNTQKLTADDVVNRYEYAQLVKIFYEYGEEPQAKFFAKTIIAHRPISTAKQLADLLASKAYYQKTHPATRVFQAIRIEVNQEIQEIQNFLSFASDLLKPNGRLVMISFHSIEDRLIKNKFINLTKPPPHGSRHIPIAPTEYQINFQNLTPKPIIPTPEEISKNPRSRSAKLRAIIRK